MKKKYLFLFLCLMLSYISSAAHDTQQFTFEQARRMLTATTATTWLLPGTQQEVSLRWYERHSSFSSEHIRTYVAYAGDTFVGTASASDQFISGEIMWKGKSYRLTTVQQTVLLQATEEPENCGTCCEKNHQQPEKPLQQQDLSIRPTLKSHTPPTLQFNNEPHLYSDGVLRVYRLALMVEYNIFSTTYASDINRVKLFWAGAETALNEIYMRDLGIRFQVINNEHLIRKSAAEELHSPTWSAQKIIEAATPNFNKVIGEQAYDVGLVITNNRSSGIAGMASLHGVYAKSVKGYALANTNYPTIGHEIGHLFGAEHTFSAGGDVTMKTEPSSGTSIMSYGHQESRDFFSLANIWYIKNSILNSKDYYVDPQRTQVVGPHNSDNIPYGIPSDNRAPIIDRSKIAKHYRIPKETEFQFHISAVDPDGDPLCYAAHQTDIRRYNEPSVARFRSYKPSSNNLIVYQPTFREDDGSILPYSASGQYPEAAPTGTYTFWLAAYDGLSPSARQNNPNHCTRYDVVQTSVEIVEGTPFKFTGIDRSSVPLKRGEKRTIRWDVDTSIFGNDSKVRILLSDDLGKNFPYVLEECTENDGQHEVVIPYIEAKKVKKFPLQLSTNEKPFESTQSLVFKIEVIGHIAHAISNNDIRSGGISIERHRSITFQNVPTTQITVNDWSEMPSYAEITAQNRTGGTIPVSYAQEQITPLCIKRTWTAESSGNKAFLVQHVYLNTPATTLAFTGQLPQDMEVTCLSQIPQPQAITHNGGEDAQLHFQQIKVNGDEPCYSVQRIWTLTAPNADPISHTQVILVHDYQKPEFSQQPPHMVVHADSEIPQQPQLVAVDDCDGRVNITTSHEVIWDSQKGQKGGVIYRWQAKDQRQQEALLEQYIFIDTDGTVVKNNVAALRQEANNLGKYCIAHLSHLMVTYNDGWNAYVEDRTGGLLIRRLPTTFKAGDLLTENFELITVVGNGSDPYGRPIFEYKAHQGEVLARGQSLPLLHTTIAELQERPQDFEYRRVMVEGLPHNHQAFVKGLMTLREKSTATTARTLAVKGEFPTPIASSVGELALVGYYAPHSNDGAFFEVVQQQDVWGKLYVSHHGYATHFVDAPFFMPTTTVPYAEETTPLPIQAAIVANASQEDALTLDYRFAAASLVPKETPLLIKAPKGVYYYQFTIDTPDPLLGTNLLRGSLAETTVHATNGEKFYYLTADPQLGFYWQQGTQGNSVRNGAGKCYLAVPATMGNGVQGFQLDLNLITALPAVEVPAPKADAIYDLSGRRVQQVQKGIYIIGGKKVVR